MPRRLNRKQAWDICDERAQGDAYATARKFGVSEDTVWGIWSGRRWGALNHPLQYPGPRASPSQREKLERRVRDYLGYDVEKVMGMTGLSRREILDIWENHQKTLAQMVKEELAPPPPEPLEDGPRQRKVDDAVALAVYREPREGGARKAAIKYGLWPNEVVAIWRGKTHRSVTGHDGGA